MSNENRGAADSRQIAGTSSKYDCPLGENPTKWPHAQNVRLID